MNLKQFTWNIVDSNSWLILEGPHGLLIDAVDSEELYEAIEHLASLSIILTHSHFDHIIGLNRIRAIKPETIVIATKQCSLNIGDIHKNLSSTATAFLSFYEQGRKSNTQIKAFTCTPAQVTFKGAEKVFNWQGHKVELKAVYGHSNDGLVAFIDQKLLFSGDTLLAVPTVTRFPGGNKKRYQEEDIPLLKSIISKKCYVYPGHGVASKLVIFKKGVPIKIQPMNKMPTPTGDSALPVVSVEAKGLF